MPVKQILIVDDSEIIQQRLRERLSNISNIEVLNPVSSISEAINTFNKFHPGIVILNIQLADGLGFGVLDVIKNQNPETIVIMFTNYAQAEFRKRSLDGGADFFIDKSNGSISIYDFIRWFAHDRSVEGVFL